MNKTNKQHWYDKPLKFLYFLAVLLPFGLLLGNYITAQIDFQKWDNTHYIYNYEGQLEGESESPNFNNEGIGLENPEYINYELEFYTPIQTAFYFTNIELSGGFFFESGESFTNNTLFYPQWYQDLMDSIINTEVLGTPNNMGDNFTNASLNIFLARTLFYEVWITIVFIVLKVILFIPNIICYVLEWAERKLNV